MLYGHVVGRLDARQKLDQIVLSVSNKCQLLENAEVTAVRCVMLEDHARFCFFVDCMKPLMVCVTNWLLYGVVTDLISRELDNAVGRARPSVCFYSSLIFWATWPPTVTSSVWVMTIARQGLKVKVMDQSQRSMQKCALRKYLLWHPVSIDWWT